MGAEADTMEMIAKGKISDIMVQREHSQEIRIVYRDESTAFIKINEGAAYQDYAAGKNLLLDFFMPGDDERFASYTASLNAYGATLEQMEYVKNGNTTELSHTEKFHTVDNITPLFFISYPDIQTLF